MGVHMADELEVKLGKRYGKARFNPSAGQTEMSYQEWLDRHPGQKDSDEAKARYEKAVGAEGGAEYQKKNPGWQTIVVGAPKGLTADKLDALGKSIAPKASGFEASPAQEAAVRRFFQGALSDLRSPRGGPDKGGVGKAAGKGGVGKAAGKGGGKFGAFAEKGGKSDGPRGKSRKPKASAPESLGGSS